MPKPRTEAGAKNLVGVQLKLLRDKQNISQRELAHQLQLLGLNVDENVITRIETNKRYVTDFEIKVLAQYFGVSYEYLIDGEDSEK